MRRLVCLALVALAAVACEERETNTPLCRAVYTAWCERAHECDELEAVNACIAYYREDCRFRALHRDVPEPEDAELQACVDAIAEMSCDLPDPSALPECPFLVQPEPDAGVDGGDGGIDAGDGGGDAEAGAEAGADGG